MENEYIIIMKDKKADHIKSIKWSFNNCSTEDVDYMLSEGNYACDCNRYTMFYSYDEDAPCGEDRFEILMYSVKEPDGGLHVGVLSY